MMAFPDWSKVVLIVGKGPTARRVLEDDERIVCALNGAAKLCDRVDWLFVNDTAAIRELNPDLMSRVANLVLPTELHVHTNGSITRPWGETPDWFRQPVVHLHQLRSAKVKRKDIKRFGRVISVAEVAVAFFLDRGILHFQTLGIDPGTRRYHSTFAGGPQATWKGANWYRQNWERITNRVENAGGTITRLIKKEA